MITKKKALQYGLLSFIVLIVVVLILLPGIAKNYIINNSKELTGRQLFMDKLSVNYFSGKLSVYDFKMFEPDEKEVFISFDTLVINTVPYKYLFNTMALDQFYLDGLVVNISKKDSVFNFDDLVIFYSKNDSTEIKSKDDKVFKYILNNLELNRANLNFYDANVDHTTSLEDFSFLIPQIYWDQENQSDADLKFHIADGGSIEANFHMQPQTKDFDGRINVVGLPLKSFYKYAAQYANINAIEGKLGIDINLKGNTNALNNIHLSSEVVLEDFEMWDTNDKSFLASKTITGSIPELNFSKNSITVASVIIDKPYVNFEMDSISNNFFRIFNINNEETSESQPFDYLIQSVKISDGSVDYSNNLMAEPFDYQFSAIDGHWTQETKDDANANIKLEIENGGHLTGNFQFQPEKKDFQADITVAGLQLEPFYKYTVSYMNINSMNGEVGGKINLKGNLDVLDDVRIASNIILENFEMKDVDDQTFLASKKLVGNFPKLDFKKNSILASSVVIDQAYINFELDSISNNYSRIFDVPSENSSTSTPFDYHINSFKVTNSLMDYSDNLTGKPFNYHFNAIEINSKDITNAKDWIEIKSNMLLNNRGTLQAEIGINPNNLLTAQIDVAVENFLLSDLDLYSNYYMGHSILVGDMIYFSNTKLTNGDLESDNRLVIKNVDVRNNKGGLYAIPLKFAIWILKDRNGDIELEVPVTGNLNDPEVDTWALVWATLKKRIFNATDNPVRPLARFIGAKPEDIEKIAFNYHDTLITAEQSRQLDLILKLEEEKKGVEIEMNFLADSKILNELIAQQMPLDSIQTEPVKHNTNQDLTANTKIPTEDLDATNPEISDANANLLDSLATNYTESMIRNVKNYVLNKNANTKITVQKAKVSNSDIVGASPQIKVKYAMRDEEEK